MIRIKGVYMANVWNRENSALRVCVDETGEGGLKGCVVGARLSAPMEFECVEALVLKVKAVMDLQNYPQAFQRIRTFAAEERLEIPAALSLEEGMQEQAVQEAHGTVGTFLLHVTTRRNATWQGYVDWLDGSGRQEFDSVLEFIKLTDCHPF